MARRPARLVQKAPASQRLITLFALLAFFIQSFALQTHIHSTLLPPVSVTTAADTPTPSPLKNQDPVDQCRLCQELVHAGVFVSPSATVIAASLNIVAAIFAALPVFAADPVRAFSWQSRAPPRH
jgi:hypothetical protein